MQINGNVMFITVIFTGLSKALVLTKELQKELWKIKVIFAKEM